MELPLSTPALLFPAIAILMLGFINRYVAAANVIRTFKKDYDTGYVHTKIVYQLEMLKTRIELFRYMLGTGVIALILACLSMFFIFAEHQSAGNAAFGLSLLAMVVSLCFSLYETSLSNRALIVEIDDVVASEHKKHK